MAKTPFSIKKNIIFFIFLFFIFIKNNTVVAIDLFNQDGVCIQNSEESSNCLEEQNNKINKKTESTSEKTPVNQKSLNIVYVYLFWGEGCPHCKAEKNYLNKLREKYKTIKIIDYEVWYNKQNAEKLERYSSAYGIKTAGVPVTFIGENSFIGFSEHTKKEIEEALLTCLNTECINPENFVLRKTNQSISNNFITKATPDVLECQKKSNLVYIPWFGKIDSQDTSIPILTIIIAGLDSFNPCAFFVLFSLLGLLIHAKSRKKILLIGSTFVFFSGFIYFLFMSAWLNLFLIMGKVELITYVAGAIAFIIAIINIKDYFIFKKGVSLTIPDSAKPKLFDRMRRLLKSSSLIPILIGTTILAISANSYELLCTAGFPMIFTRILTLRNLSNIDYYMYLILYNIIYIIPLTIIVLIFTITLGKRNLTEWQGRVLKLVSGMMMLGLSIILIFNPALLSNVFLSIILLLGSIFISGLIVITTKNLIFR